MIINPAKIPFFQIPVFLVLAGILVSCVNDLESIKKVTFKSTDPEERTKHLKMIYSDSGIARIELYAAFSERFSTPERVVKFKEGIRVDFFDNNGAISSTLTSLYAEILEDKELIVIKDSVRLFNTEKQQLLETEELFWNRKDSSIYTEKPVIIRTPEALFYGIGVRTKQDFSSYEFLEPRGRILMKDKNKFPL